MSEEERNGGSEACSPPVSTPANLPTKRVQKPLLNKMTNEALNQQNCEFNHLAEWREPYKMDSITLSSLTRVRREQSRPLGEKLENRIH